MHNIKLSMGESTITRVSNFHFKFTITNPYKDMVNLACILVRQKDHHTMQPISDHHTRQGHDAHCMHSNNETDQFNNAPI